MKDLLFLLLFLPFMYLALKNPFIGLCAWIWTVMAVPKNMLWGFASDIRFTYVLAIITIVALLINKDPLMRKPSGGIWILIIIFLVHTVISNTFTIGSSLYAWSVWNEFFKAVIFTTLIIMLLTTRNRIETFIFCLLLGVGFNIFFEGMKFLATGGSYQITGIDNSMMTDNNLFALAILMVLPLYLYAIGAVGKGYLKIGFMGLAGLSVVTIIGSFSRGGFVGLLVVSSQTFLKSKYKIVFIVIAVIFTLLALNIASEKWTDRMQTINSAKTDNSFLGRVTSWKLATLTALDRPFIGGGQDAVQHLHVWTRYYPELYKLDFIPSFNTSPDKPKAAHSIYFQVLGDAGFIGLLLFLTILIKSLLLSKKLAKKSDIEWVKRLAFSVQASLMVFMVSGSLLSLAYYDLIYALIGIVICLQYIDKKNKNATSN